MHAIRRLVLIAAAASISGCSVWQNASRKYLDKSAYDLAGIKVRESLVGCAEPVADPSWTELSADDRARVLARDFDDAFELRVEIPATARACDYRFATADDRAASTPAARIHALAQSRLDEP